MTDMQTTPVRSAADQDRFYVQLDKHSLFQKWGKDDDTSPLPTLKDAFIFAASVGWARERRLPLVKRQHVGFWRSFDSRDVAMLHAIAIAETGDPAVVGDQGEVIKIAEEYANGGIDFLLTYDRADRDRTLAALAGLISGMDRDGADVTKRARTIEAVQVPIEVPPGVTGADDELEEE
jgi:dnd system-associated protein 4